MELNCEFMNYVGTSTKHKLGPRQIALFRFDIKKELKDHIDKIFYYHNIDEKIKSVVPNKTIKYAYTIVDERNNKEPSFASIEEDSKKLLFDYGLLKLFKDKQLYKCLLGKSSFAQSFITSEYLRKQYDCNDCFDYTAIVNGYLKSIEQLLYEIVLLFLDKSFYIKYDKYLKDINGKSPIRYKYNKDSNRYEKDKNGMYVELKSDNISCIDSTIGSLIYFFKYNPLLISVSNWELLINCLDLYRQECRNELLHKDNLNSWSRVEIIRDNTVFLYVLLLTGIKMGLNDNLNALSLWASFDDRFEELYYMINCKGITNFEFIFNDGERDLPSIEVAYDLKNSSFISFDNFGFANKGYLSFIKKNDNQKVRILRSNVPEIRVL